MNEAAPTLAPNTMPEGGVSLHTRECSFALLTSDGQNLGLGAGVLEVGLYGSKDAGRHGAVGDDGGWKMACCAALASLPPCVISRT